MTYSSVEGPGSRRLRGGPARVTTKTGYGGAYAFIDMPVARGGTCYRLVIMAPGVGRYESIDVIDPGVYDHTGLELVGDSVPESYLDSDPGEADGGARSSVPGPSVTLMGFRRSLVAHAAQLPN